MEMYTADSVRRLNVSNGQLTPTSIRFETQSGTNFDDGLFSFYKEHVFLLLFLVIEYITDAFTLRLMNVDCSIHA